MGKRHLKRRVVAQRIQIITVLVPGSNRKNPRAQDIREGMNHPRLIAVIGNVPGKPVDNSQASLGLSQEKHTGIRSDRATIKRGGDFLGQNGWK
jgi:hypothetical protein